MSTFISKQTLAQRINRALESRALEGDEGGRLKKTGNFDQVYKELGEYYMIWVEPVYDVRTETHIEPHVNLEELGQILGVLKVDERLRPQKKYAKKRNIG